MGYQDDVKKTSKKRSDEKWAIGFDGRQFPGSVARRKPLASMKFELRKKVPAYLTRPGQGPGEFCSLTLAIWRKIVFVVDIFGIN